MTVRVRAMVFAVFVSGTPVEAEPTPALPFWSRPFPTGYARRPYADDLDGHRAVRRECVVRHERRIASGRIVIIREYCRHRAIRTLD